MLSERDMMSDKYFVILGSKEGRCSIREMSKEAILKMMIPNEHGDYEYGKRVFLDPEQIPCNLSSYEDAVIIKGEIIVHRLKMVVKEYEL